MKAKKYAMVAEGAKCEVCQGSLFQGKVFYDAKTHSGQWGWLCRTCFLAYCKGVGVGLGQEYDSKTKEKLRG